MEVRFNGDWLGELRADDVIRIGARSTVARMLERDDFAKRYRDGVPIGIHEFLYPLMQAYDSVEVRADVELGGTDQTFNILLGRHLQKEAGQSPQVAVILPLLEGTDGTQKMSKSLGNYIGVAEPPAEMFGKVMSISDELMLRYYELLTAEDVGALKVSARQRRRASDGAQEAPRRGAGRALPRCRCGRGRALGFRAALPGTTPRHQQARRVRRRGTRRRSSRYRTFCAPPGSSARRPRHAA